MKWPDINKDWPAVSKQFQAHWPKLEKEDLKAIAGKREELIRRLERRYEVGRTQLENEIDAFCKSLEPMKA